MESGDPSYPQEMPKDKFSDDKGKQRYVRFFSLSQSVSVLPKNSDID